MQKGLISVVVPIYNVEKYLERCILSIVNQTYCNLEILLIDDESPDRCPQLCEDWAKKDSRIKVIHKKNEGLGMARNTGIENATGEYICFFDSDDYIAIDTIEKTYLAAKKDIADIVCFGFNNVDEHGKVISSRIPRVEKKTYVGREVQEIFLPNLITFDSNTGVDWNLQMSACMALFSLPLINKVAWRFVSEREIISEDVYSLLELYQYVEKVVVISEAFYFYCANITSLTRKYQKNRYEKIKIFYLKSSKLIKEAGYNQNIYKRIDGPYISFTIAAMKQIANSDCEYREKIKDLSSIMNDNTLQITIKDRVSCGEPISRRILFKLIKLRWYFACFALCRLRQ